MSDAILREKLKYANIRSMSDSERASMVKKIEIEFPDIRIRMTANLSENMNPKLCDLLWNNLPIESICSHFMSSGEEFGCPIPMFGVVPDVYNELETESPKGTIVLKTETARILFVYGKGSREALPWSPVGKVLDEDLENLDKAGKAVFWSHCITHFPLRVVFRRKQ